MALSHTDVCSIIFGTGKNANIPTEFTALKNKVEKLEERIKVLEEDKELRDSIGVRDYEAN